MVVKNTCSQKGYTETVSLHSLPLVLPNTALEDGMVDTG